MAVAAERLVEQQPAGGARGALAMGLEGLDDVALQRRAGAQGKAAAAHGDLVGDEVAIEGGALRVERLDGRRVDRIRYTPDPEEPATGGAS